MNLGRIIKSLSWKQLIKLVYFALMRPIFFYCFVKATKQCIGMSTSYFGKTHHKNNKANAYRHALWNMLIAYRSTKAGKSLSKALDWAKTITDWHESAFANKDLEKAMDLHNNKMGRIWFEEIYRQNNALSTTDLHHKLMKELDLSEKVSTVNSSAFVLKTLVYINNCIDVFTFENYQFKMDDQGFIPLSEFADPLFENDVVSLARIVTEQPDDVLFKKKNVKHNIRFKKVEIPPEPMFPDITHRIACQGGIHKDSFADYTEIMRSLQKQSSEWFEKFVDDYNEEVKKRFPKR